MTDVEQVFQLVVDFLRRKGLVAIATKLENSERAKIGKLSEAPTRLEALLLKGIALEQETKSWEIGEEDGESRKTHLDSVREDDDEPELDLDNKNSLPKHVKSKAKQMGLSKSMTHTSMRTVTPMLSTSIQRSDAPAVSILARAEANKAVIRLPSRVTYRHSREPHTPLRTLNKERRAASVVYVNRPIETLPSSATTPSNLGKGVLLTIQVDTGTPIGAGSPISYSDKKKPHKITESLDEHSDEDGFTIKEQGAHSKPKETVGPTTRGPFEIYPKPNDDSDSESTKESESEEEETIIENSKSGTDPSIFSMDLEDTELKPDPKPSKRLNFSIKNANNMIPPKQSSSKKKPEPLGPPPKKGQTKTLAPNPPTSGTTNTTATTNTTTTIARSPPTEKPSSPPQQQLAEVQLNFSEVNLVSNPGDPKLEYFNLKIIYQINHTGFEESRDFPIRLHDIVAGRYEITGYIGSAAFSRAVNCIDHKTGQSACMKIIKNNKDFFDQCLDELKLLKYIKVSGDTEKYHVLEMYDYFYFKEHLFIVCELLGDNLYEFYKKNMSNANEAHYFTLSRVQKVTKQCLIALQYIHSLGLIHCDLKPENILMKNVDACEIKVIDFGSSCFTTDVLSTYVQSRSYRAPEVILGLPYGQKIDLWSLGCILAELLTGRVIFQNYSVVTLLARIIGIIGPIPEAMLQKGSFVNKYFMEDGELYENTEIITPKKTTLQRRTKTDDSLFLDFLRKLLTVDPNRRPTASDALQHPWLKKVYT